MDRKNHRQYDPFSPPAWRWETAGEICRGVTRWNHVVDQAVMAAVALLATQEKPGDRGAQRRISPALAAAHEIFVRNGPQRWEIEARLVAGESAAQIARKCGLSRGTVARYAETFFDVQSALDARDYLVVHVVGRGIYEGFRNEEVKNFWAWVAMSDGVRGLDAIVTAFTKVQRADRPPTLMAYLEPGVDVDPGIQALVAATVLPRFGVGAEAPLDCRIRLCEAQGVRDPDRAAFLRERARGHLVRDARNYLLGRLTPRRKRCRGTGSGGPPTASEKTVSPAALLLELADSLRGGLDTGDDQARPKGGGFRPALS